MKRLARYGPREIVLRAWTLVWLMLVWTMLWGNFSVANTINGLLVALVITVLLPMPRLPVEGRLHVVSMIRLAFTVGWYMVLSSLQVAWWAIRPGPPPLSAVLRAQLLGEIGPGDGSPDEHLDDHPRIGGPGDRPGASAGLRTCTGCGLAQSRCKFYAQLRQLERLFISAFERDVDWHPDTNPLRESDTREEV